MADESELAEASQASPARQAWHSAGDEITEVASAPGAHGGADAAGGPPESAPRRSPADILRLDDAEPSPRAVSFALPADSAGGGGKRTVGLARQQSLTRRGQSFPATFMPAEYEQAIDAQNNAPARLPSPVIRETRTPDHESRLWPTSPRDPAADRSPRHPAAVRSPRHPAAVGLSPTRSSQLLGGRVKPGTARAAGRWKMLRGNFVGSDHDEKSDPFQEPTLLERRQSELKGTLQVNHAIKQALYDQWTPKTSHGMVDDLADLEVYVKTHVQKFIKDTVAYIKGSEPANVGRDLALKSGFVLSQRRGLFGAKTVRHYVQLCVDGTFIMRKTEQPASPIIAALHVHETDVEDDPTCDLTLKLIPQGLQRARSAPNNITQRQLGLATRHRPISFTVNDPSAKQEWLQAFDIQKRIASEEESVKLSVASFVNQLKLSSTGDTSAVSRATSGLIKSHQRQRNRSVVVPPIATRAINRSTSAEQESTSPHATRLGRAASDECVSARAELTSGEES
eukprot:Tamp_13139.p1 GENE.Tamp_13139~~Tamp_13139.p1  ORF type:complete len:511 (+),score=58.44 Tamp_13139:30-1562(+)